MGATGRSQRHRLVFEQLVEWWEDVCRPPGIGVAGCARVRACAMGTHGLARTMQLGGQRRSLTGKAAAFGDVRWANAQVRLM